jgi:RNA 2',3'-cyclic 3'-phosphodiesterase
VRAFVAIEVPAISTVPSRSPAPEHLTLLFLGEIPAERVPPIVEALTPIGASIAPFDLTLDGVGAFPSPERPRVVWTGATDGAEALARLAGEVRRALAKEGEPGRRDAFVPHLTLFRVRSVGDRRRAIELLSGVVPAPAPRRVRVGEFVLKESELSAHGATHRTLARFPLTGSGTAATTA